MATFLSLFLSSFAAATFLPVYSEVLLLALVSQHEHYLLLWSIASAGNTLGCTVNWYLGKYLLHFQNKKWFWFKPEALQNSQRWFHRYGSWTLLMAWMPVVGDTLPCIAGVMRLPLWKTLVFAGVGKSVRYAFIIGLYFAASKAATL